MVDNTKAVTANTKVAILQSGNVNQYAVNAADASIADAMWQKKKMPTMLRHSWIFPIAMIAAIALQTIPFPSPSGFRVFVAIIYSIVLVFASFCTVAIHVLSTVVVPMIDRLNESQRRAASAADDPKTPMPNSEEPRK